MQQAQTLLNENRTTEAITLLQEAAALYPNQAEVARSLVSALVKANRWADAATVARQFAATNPNSALASDFIKLAEEAQKVALTGSASSTNSNAIKDSLLRNVLTTGLGYLLTGRITTPLSNGGSNSWSSLQPSTSSRNQLVQDLLNRVQLVNDPDVVNYVNDIGQKLVGASGKSNQAFQFYVVKDKDAGAIALPDGRIFVSAGAIANTNSEAALANILAQQVGHSVLSHPDRLVTRGNVTSTLARILPVVGGLVSPKLSSNSLTGSLVSGLMGNLVNGLVKQNYSSRMIRDAEQLGTKLLDKAGYAQGSLINISTTSDRHVQIKAKTQQILGIASSTPWWSLGRY